MKVLALDLSSSATGWFVDKDNCAVIDVDKKLEFPEKLSFLRARVLELLEQQRPDVVVIEDVYLRFQAGTFKQLARVSGVVMEACATVGIPIEAITATQARKHCCGKPEKGKKSPTKQQVYKHFVDNEDFNQICQRLWGKDCTFDRANDLTDAAAVCFGYKLMQKGKED